MVIQSNAIQVRLFIECNCKYVYRILLPTTTTIIIIISYYFLSTTRILSPDSAYVKFVRYNLKILHCRHICNCELRSLYIICENVYNLSSYKISYS